MTTPEIIVCNAFISVIIGIIVSTIFSCMIIKTKEAMEDKLLEIKKTNLDNDLNTLEDISEIRRDFINLKCNILTGMREKEMREKEMREKEMREKAKQNTAVSYDCALADIYFNAELNESCIDYIIGVRRPRGLNPTCCYKHTVLPSKWNREEAENAPEPEIISNDGHIVIFKHFDVIYKYIVQENACYLV